jgi:hypothetical protein
MAVLMLLFLHPSPSEVNIHIPEIERLLTEEEA